MNAFVSKQTKTVYGADLFLAIVFCLYKKKRRYSIVKKTIKTLIAGCLAATLAVTSTATVSAADIEKINTKLKVRVVTEGQYVNWDGVPSVAQFTDENGEFCFAYSTGKKIKVAKTKDGRVSKKMNLEMQGGSIFGSVTCDENGMFYVVTGEENTGEDTSKNTVFITKYDKDGNVIKTVGDNGRSSLADYYDDSFNTKDPFNGGTCDVAVNGHFLAVDYGRGMYSGHQSNSVWMIDTDTMNTVTPAVNDYFGYHNYQSHSFGQRAIAYGGGFAFMSEGDCYDRSFTFSTADFALNTAIEQPVFDFWVEKGTFDSYNMYILNNNFAHIGDLCDLGNGTVSFVAGSAKSMNQKASDEIEQIFIQIFDPTMDLSSESAYVTTGKRTGTAGKNGDEDKTNYGVKWLTGYKSGSALNPQAVADKEGNTIILFERYKNYKYLGVYSIKVDSNGNVIQKAKRVSKNAMLNSCETPVYSDGYVYWCGNKYTTDYDPVNKLFVYKYKV